MVLLSKLLLKDNINEDATPANAAKPNKHMYLVYAFIFLVISVLCFAVYKICQNNAVARKSLMDDLPAIEEQSVFLEHMGNGFFHDRRANMNLSNCTLGSNNEWVTGRFYPMLSVLDEVKEHKKLH